MKCAKLDDVKTYVPLIRTRMLRGLMGVLTGVSGTRLNRISYFFTQKKF